MKKRDRSARELRVWHLESNQQGASVSIIFLLANTVPQLSSKQCLPLFTLELYTWKGSSRIKTGRDDNEPTVKVLLLWKFLFSLGPCECASLAVLKDGKRRKLSLFYCLLESLICIQAVLMVKLPCWGFYSCTADYLDFNSQVFFFLGSLL